MNRILKTALLGTLLAGAAAPARAEVAQIVKPTSDGFLNVRSGPGTHYADLGDLPSGTVINVLGYDPSGRWAIILWQGQVAYVARGFLDDVPAPAAIPAMGLHKVTGIAADDPDGGLVVRAGPGRDFPRILVLPEGVSVNVVEISPDGKWSRAVFSDGGSGWLRNSYLTPAGAPAQGGSRVVSTQAPVQVFEFPDDTAPVLARLPAGTPVAVLEDLHRDWARVSVAGQEGYMHLQATGPGGIATTAGGMPLGLACAGTEPFWTFSINSDGTTRFENVGAQEAPIPGSLSSVSGSNYPYAFQAGAISGQLTNRACSDGMSEITYPWEVILSAPMGGGMQSVQGCCLLQ